MILDIASKMKVGTQPTKLGDGTTQYQQNRDRAQNNTGNKKTIQGKASRKPQPCTNHKNSKKMFYNLLSPS